MSNKEKKEKKQASSYLLGFRDGFNKGWEDVIDHLCTIPWDEALKELEMCIKERSESNGGR